MTDETRDLLSALDVAAEMIAAQATRLLQLITWLDEARRDVQRLDEENHKLQQQLRAVHLAQDDNLSMALRWVRADECDKRAMAVQIAELRRQAKGEDDES